MIFGICESCFFFQNWGYLLPSIRKYNGRPSSDGGRVSDALFILFNVFSGARSLFFMARVAGRCECVCAITPVFVWFRRLIVLGNGSWVRYHVYFIQFSISMAEYINKLALEQS